MTGRTNRIMIDQIGQVYKKPRAPVLNMLEIRAMTGKNGTSENLTIHQFGCLSDNYGYLIHEPGSSTTIAVDTPDAGAILQALDDRGWTLTHILNTHHHYDHTGGNLELKEKTGCIIIGPADEKGDIPGRDEAVRGGDCVTLAEGAMVADVLDVGGHTVGHVAYWFRQAEAAFVGDALFTLGCGRMFEGTPDQMWTGLERLRALPDATRIYCAHEYTEANLKFALSVEPGNSNLLTRSRKILALRKDGQPTVPTTIGEEKETNPFLRPESLNLQETIGKVGAPFVDIFAETRRLKDNF